VIALHDLLAPGRVPDTPVCRDGGATLDFAAFRERVDALVISLRDRTAVRYALCIDDTFEFACTLFALLACGKEPVIPANAAPGYLAELAGAYDAVLTGTGTGARALDARAPVTANTPLSIDPHAPLTLYTSGSSGTPKPVRKTLAQFDAEVRTLEAQWGDFIGTATVFASVPHHHIYGLLFRVLWPLAAGRAFDRVSIVEPLQLQQRIGQCGGAAVVVSTPAQLSRWPASAGFAALTPRGFFSSGGALAAGVVGEYTAAFGAAPIEIFGSTETGGIAWRRQDESDAWRPLTGVDVRRDHDGALNVRSPHLGDEHWHRTDDAIKFDAAGRFHLHGRLDRVVKLDGKRVSLPEIEARLALHPYVAQAAVAPLPGAARSSRERAGAVVVLTEAGNAALCARGRVQIARTLRRHLAAYFDVVVLPRHWRFRLALPFDARGKLPVAAVAGAFEPRADGVELLAESRSGDALRYELRVPPALVHFAGHFPGLPILPGVVQVDWAIRFASAHGAGASGVASIDRLKFLAPVPPGAFLDLTLAPDVERHRVQFAYRLAGRECASGVIVWRERS
jgi:acyl-coenzyme A synthetase/AMP-(fatty) acid ligase/3-hydroxymyristoyl/3-hydroxydecanoyl-(acyl carrier protein) dehydratase